MNEIEKRTRYVETVMNDIKDPVTYLFNSMLKRWRTYATDLYRHSGCSWGGAVRSTYIYGCRNHIWVRIGKGRYRSVDVKVSNRGHIYLE